MNVKPVLSNPAFTPFINNVYDTDGLVRLLDEIELIQRALFRGKEGPISEKSKDFTTSNIISIFQDLEKAGLEPTTDQGQTKFLKDLVGEIKKLPIVKVTIAFEPTNTFVRKLNSQISAMTGGKIILEIVINSYVVGGATFEYKGKISRQTLDLPLESVLAGLVRKAA